MHRIEGTNFYYFSTELEPDARISYRINVNITQGGPDPLNKRETLQTFLGPSSEIAMPEWKRPAHLDEPKGQRGRVDSLNFESAILKNSRIIDVYLPVGYEQNEQRYPTVYVNNGRLAIQRGLMLNTLDNVIDKTVEPIIVVFVDAPNSGIEYARGGRDQFAQMMAEEIVPMIDKKYRTKADAKFRAFMGGDEGGYAAIYTTFKHPGIFSKIGGQSTHLLGNGNGGDELRALVDGSEKLDVSFYLDWATYTYRSAQGNFNWKDLNIAFANLLKDKGYSVTTHQANEGWGYANWRNRTDKVLEFFFPLQSTKK